MPDAAARDPHTMLFDRSGDVWFTVQGGNLVGRLQPSTGAVYLIHVSTPKARPYGIVLDSKERPWVAEFGTNKIALVKKETLELKEYSLPRAGARPRRLAVTSDDRIWYVDYAGGFLGRLDPDTGQVKEWPAPGADRSKPYAMTVDDHDRLWFVETGVQPNRLVGFDPKSEKFFSVTEIGSGAGAVRHMVFHKPTRAIWFGTDNSTIGRAEVP